METDPLPCFIFLSRNIRFFSGSGVSPGYLPWIMLLVLLSALISAAGIAYSTLSARIQKYPGSGKGRLSPRILKLLEHQDSLDTALNISGILVNTAAVILSAEASGLLDRFPQPGAGQIALSCLLIFLFLLLVTRLVPGWIAGCHAASVARLTAIPADLLHRVFRPFHKLLVSRQTTSRVAAVGSMDELSRALELSGEAKSHEDKDLLEGIAHFGRKNVAGIMRSRVDVAALSLNDSFEKVINLIIDSGYSRIPVYSGSFDNIRGILYIKDLLPYIHKPETFRWQSLIRPPFFVPESKKIDDLLQEFQQNKVHMAIVVDEYGGSSGLVTLQDILEEIVGDISDEFDEDEHYSTRISEHKYLFDGKIQLDDFCRFTGCNIHTFDDCRGDADTLAGLILELKGEIPVPHEKITCKNFIFAIETADNRRIRKIRVEKVQL
ncbi:MAG: gliding motility-associated protein GldE [Mangrovibacterium sp.]